jgi:hypothetical protein
MKMIIVFYLKLFDYPFWKAVVDTIVGVILCLIGPLLFVLGNLLRESLNLPWRWGCTWDFWGLDWLRDIVAAIIEFFVNTVFAYFDIFSFVILGVFFIRLYYKRKSISSFVALYVFKKVTTPLLISYFIFILVDSLIRTETFSKSEFLFNRWSATSASASGITFFLILIFLWFICTYALNKQSEIVSNENGDGESFMDKLHKIRKEELSKLG